MATRVRSFRQPSSTSTSSSTSSSSIASPSVLAAAPVGALAVLLPTLVHLRSVIRASLFAHRICCCCCCCCSNLCIIINLFRYFVCSLLFFRQTSNVDFFSFFVFKSNNTIIKIIVQSYRDIANRYRRAAVARITRIKRQRVLMAWRNVVVVISIVVVVVVVVVVVFCCWLLVAVGVIVAIVAVGVFCYLRKTNKIHFNMKF